MSGQAHRVNVILDSTYVAKLRALAERTYLSEETLAGFLLATALDRAVPDGGDVADLLDAIPDALDRARLGRRQADAGLGIPLDAL